MVERCSYRRECEISHFTSSNSRHPSFSSTLLDAIYRSFDEGEDQMVVYREGVRKKQSSCSDGADLQRGVLKNDEEMVNFRRACMIEKWMEKKVTEKAVADFQVKKPRKDRGSSSWSSSDSSCGGGGFFSSSEAESFSVRRPKPIRTGFVKEKNASNHSDFEFNCRGLEPKPMHENGFSNTKLQALKIYGDLKKVKQPISPGGKLAGFLNALFTGRNLKKNKVAANGSDDSPSLKSTNASTCSSASSFSRSCLSKTSSSRGKASTAKRSVRFSPVSVIVDEDCQPCGHKSLRQGINRNNKKQTSNFEAAKNQSKVHSIRSVINEELAAHVKEKTRRVEEVARDRLRSYQRKNHQVGFEQELPLDHHFRKSLVKSHVCGEDFDDQEDDDGGDDDDAASYASSDLFELDNLSAIGMEKYREELPVYETTNLLGMV